MFGWENSKPKQIVKWHDLEQVLWVAMFCCWVCTVQYVAHINVDSRASVDILQQDGLVPGYYFEEGVCKADKKCEESRSSN
jgi:hypothetical protein